MGIARGRSARASRRRRRRLTNTTHDLTADDWAALCREWGGCAYCGAVTGSLQRDCVLPITRGGRYTLGNVVPACRRCNASKCNAEVTLWMRRKRLDEASFLVRYAEVLAVLESRTTTNTQRHVSPPCSGSDPGLP